MNLRVNFPLFTALRDSSLIKKARNGDREAFGKLYIFYLDQIYRYIFFRIGQDRESAEDIAQTVFMKAFENIKDFKTGKGTFKAWLYTIARNKTIDHLRNGNSRIELNEHIQDESQNLEESYIKQNGISEIMQSLKILPKVQREVIVLSYINDLSNRETGQIINKSETAIRAIKYRALKNLKKFVNHD